MKQPQRGKKPYKKTRRYRKKTARMRAFKSWLADYFPKAFQRLTDHLVGPYVPNPELAGMTVEQLRERIRTVFEQMAQPTVYVDLRPYRNNPSLVEIRTHNNDST